MLWQRSKSLGQQRSPGAGLGLIMRWRHSGKLLREMLLPWLSVALLITLVTGPIGLFAWLMLKTDMVEVTAVTIIDAREHTAQAAKAITEEELQSVPFDRNMLFVNTESIEHAILQALPQVRTVYAKRTLPNTIKVIIQEKTPAILLLSNGKYYFVDSDGIPYEEARLETLPGVLLPTVKNNDSESRVTLGVPVVAPEFVAFVQYLHEHLRDYVPATVVEVRIPSLAAREVYFYLNNNWEVRFDVTRTPADQLAILRRVTQEMISAEDQQRLEYIDLRIARRVYYKLRGD